MIEYRTYDEHDLQPPHAAQKILLAEADKSIAQGEFWVVEELVSDIATGANPTDAQLQAEAYTRLAIAWAYRGQRAEFEQTAALSDLGDAQIAELRRIAAEVESHQYIEEAQRNLAEGNLETVEFLLGKVAALQPGINTDEDFMRIHYDLAVAYGHLGNREKAADHLERAGRHGELDSILPQPQEGTEGGNLVAQGDYYLELGDAATALRLYAESTVHGGTPTVSMPAIHLRMAKAAAMLGDEELARHHAEAAGHYAQTIEELAQIPLPDIPQPS